MSEWISVEDQLPVYDETVIVAGGIAYRRILDDGRWYTLTSCDYPGKPIQWDVTHWMPLPDGPVLDRQEQK